MPDEIVKHQPFKIGQKVGLAARKAKAAQEDPSYIASTIPPQEMTNRIGIEFDDSGSMHGNKIRDAHAGTEEFLRSCDPKTTSVAVYPMNQEDHPVRPLTTDLFLLAQLIKTIDATGGTPLFATLRAMVSKEPLTRGIVFSDGSPDYRDSDLEESVISLCIEKKIPIDTVYIGTFDSELMKRIAEKTGGIYLRFDPAKSNFRTAFKYLSPGYRAMLADKSFAEKLQRGEV